MRKLIPILIPLIIFGNTVTIKRIFDESESDKFLSSFMLGQSWQADSFHNSNYSTQVPNFELAKEMKESNLGCLHVRIDLADAGTFASPGFKWNGVYNACTSFVSDVGLDTVQVKSSPILNSYRTIFTFAESLGVDVNLTTYFFKNLYDTAPFPDTVCSFYSTEFDSTFYYYPTEIGIVQDFLKSFHYFFGDPDADGVEGMWASLRADSCADCSSDPNVPFCGHNHPEPFDIIKYISWGNDGIDKVPWIGDRDTVLDCKVILAKYDDVFLPPETLMFSILAYRDTVLDSTAWLESFPIIPHPSETLSSEEIYDPRRYGASYKRCFFHRRSNAFVRLLTMLHDSVMTYYPERELLFGPTFLYARDSRSRSEFDRDSRTDESFTHSSIIFPKGNIKSVVDGEKYFDYYNINPKKNELNDLSLFVEQLKGISPVIGVFDNYFFGYIIPQISKEFDLLRFGEDFIINIELKSHNTGDKIIRQIIQNRYYLSFLKKKIFSFTYISSEKKLYTLDESQNLIIVNFKYLHHLLSTQNIINIENLDILFNPSNYLVSPFNSTDEFIGGSYFLTSHQEEIKKECLQEIEKNGLLFISICGKAGTGKTLLTFDIAKHLLNE